MSALVLALLPEPAQAHGVSLGQSKIRQVGGSVHYELAVEYDELVKRLAGLATAPSPDDVPDAALEAALLDQRPELAAYLERGVRVRRDGEACDARLDTMEAERFQGTLYAIVTSTYRCPGTSGAVEVRYDLFFDPLSDRERTSHSNVADYDVDGATGRFVFERGNQTLLVGGESRDSAIGRFLALGFGHILGGLDHVLFVLALLLGSSSVRKVAAVATAFTAAHSLTLLVAALDWITVPPGIVEPAIALSIVGVAVQNILQQQPSHRLVVVFALGLLHGLGFAANLSFGDEVDGQLVIALLAFNVGIEAGQAVVILLAFPVLVLVRRQTWSRAAQRVASGILASCGAFWFIGRLPLF